MSIEGKALLVNGDKKYQLDTVLLMAQQAPSFEITPEELIVPSADENPYKLENFDKSHYPQQRVLVLKQDGKYAVFYGEDKIPAKGKLRVTLISKPALKRAQVIENAEYQIPQAYALGTKDRRYSNHRS